MDKVKIGIWTIKRERFVTPGSDPTEGIKYRISNHIDCIFTVTSLYSWECDHNTFYTIEDIDSYITMMGAPSLYAIMEAFNELDNPAPVPVVGRAPYLPKEEHEKLLAEGYTFHQEAEYCTDEGSAEYGPSVDYRAPFDEYTYVVSESEGVRVYVEENGNHYKEPFDPRWENPAQ